MTVEHATFVIERRLAASPRHAFRFWAEPDLKARWNDCHLDWMVLEEVFEFRVGGRETKVWRMPDGATLAFHGHFLDIEAEQRIVYAYRMSLGEVCLSASLATVVFAGEGRETTMTFTEQAALLTGGAEARETRIVGTEDGMDRLVELVADLPEPPLS